MISDFNYDFNSVNGIMSFLVGEYSYEDKIDEESIEKVKKLNYDRFIEVMKHFNLNNKSIVVMKNKK